MEPAMTINGETLRKYRESKNLSQAELADLSGVSKKTISRIELKEIKRPNQATRKKLAKALGVEILDLAKLEGEYEEVERRLKKAGYRKLIGFIDPETAVAYAMVQYRYGVSPQTLIEMAPLFLTILAEGSLEWRKRKADELSTAVGVLGSVSNDAPHLAYTAAGYRAEEGLINEAQSIADRDIFGKNISEEAWNFGFDSHYNNPFVDYLHLLCHDIDASALEIDPHGEGNRNSDDCLPGYLIAPTEFEAITGGNHWAEFAIERGHAHISEIPADLMGKEREAERVAWIASKIPDKARKKRQDWLDEINIKFGNAEANNV
jgi:transcriptional regulator with XRE-family HTH domain